MNIPDDQAEKLLTDLMRGAEEFYDPKTPLKWAPYSHGVAVGTLLRYMPLDSQQRAFDELRRIRRNEKRRVKSKGKEVT